MTIIRAAITQTTWTGDKASMLDKHEQFARDAKAEGAQVICFQELFYGPYFGITEDTKYYVPSGVDARLEEEIRSAALKSFRVLGCRGWGRADVMLKPDGSYYFLEMNTSPGMTGHSLVPMAAKAAGMSYADLCVKILEGARLDGGRPQ